MSQIYKASSGGGGGGAVDFVTDFGTATPSLGIININGLGTVSTYGATNVVQVGIVWTTISAGGSFQMQANHGYVIDTASQVTALLPLTMLVGQCVYIVNTFNAGSPPNGIQVNQNAGQMITYSDSSTTRGITGNLKTTAFGSSYNLICSIQDTDFNIQATDNFNSFIFT